MVRLKPRRKCPAYHAQDRVRAHWLAPAPWGFCARRRPQQGSSRVFSAGGRRGTDRRVLRSVCSSRRDNGVSRGGRGYAQRCRVGRNLAADLSANDYVAHRKGPRLLDPARTGATRRSPGAARASAGGDSGACRLFRPSAHDTRISSLVWSDSGSYTGLRLAQRRRRRKRILYYCAVTFTGEQISTRKPSGSETYAVVCPQLSRRGS